MQRGSTAGARGWHKRSNINRQEAASKSRTPFGVSAESMRNRLCDPLPRSLCSRYAGSRSCFGKIVEPCLHTGRPVSWWSIESATEGSTHPRTACEMRKGEADTADTRTRFVGMMHDRTRVRQLCTVIFL